LGRVTKIRPASAIDTAAARLRKEILAREAGAFLGSEETLQALLGVSRPTMRQAALLMEREGLLRVRRGANGGYFVARPDPDFIETTVSTYLETLNADIEDLTSIASILWVEAVRKAATLDPAPDKEGLKRLRRKIAGLTQESGFSELLDLEAKVKQVVFDMIRSPYVELIFNVNANYARRRISEPRSNADHRAEHGIFVRDWRKAKLLELDAIADGDAEVAMVAAKRARALFYSRLWL
jgi:DNA-binding GntR family transcriptional regulator